MIGVVYGGLPTTPVGTNAVGWLYSGSGPVTGVELSLNGITWSSSVTALGATISASAPSADEYDVIAIVTTNATTAGSATLFVRVQYGFGVLWSDPYQFSWTVYQPTGIGYSIVMETVASGVAAEADTYTAGQSPDGSQVIGVRAGGATVVRVNGVDYTRPAAITSGNANAFVKVALNSTVEWVAWAGTASVSAVPLLATSDNGSTVVASLATNANVSLYNQDGTFYATNTSVTTAPSTVVAQLSSGGNWYGATCRIQNGSVASISAITASDDTVAVRVSSSLSFSNVTVNGVAFPITASAPHLIYLSRSTMNAAWVKQNPFGTGPLVMDTAGAVYCAVVAASPTLDSLTPGAGVINAVAKVNASGTVAFFRGPAGSPALASTHLSLTDNRLVFTSSRDTGTITAGTTYADGAIGVTAVSGDTGIVFVYALDGTPLWAKSGQFDANLISWHGPKRQAGGTVLLHQRNGTTGASSAGLVAFDEVTGTQSWVATWTSTNADFRPGFVREPQGSTFVTLRRGGTSGTPPLTLTSSDSTTETYPAFGSYLLTLSPTGIWGETAGVPGTPGTAGEVPDPPTATWPATKEENQNILNQEVYGYDPLNTGGIAVLEVRTGGSTWSDAVTAVNMKGKGTIQIEQLGINGAKVDFDPVDDYFGNVHFDFRWRITDPDSTVRVSKPARFTTVYTNIPEAPDAPVGEMPNADEDHTSTGVYTSPNDPDNSGTYTWYLSPQTSKPANWDVTHPPDPETGEQDDWHTTTGSTVTVMKDGEPVGSVTILSQNDATRSATVRFTPVANWNGSASFDLAVSNGYKLSTWVTETVLIEPVTDKPGAPVFTLPTVAESGTEEFTVTWVDVDDLAGDATADGNYTIHIAVKPETNFQAPDIYDTTEGLLDIGPAIVRVLEYSTTDLSATMRVEGKEFINGPYTVGLRVSRNATEEGTVKQSAWVYEDSEIGSVPTPPTVVTGSMPTAKHQESVQGLFTTMDPDAEDSAWVFTIAATRTGTYGSTVSVPGIGTLTVVDSDTSNKEAHVRLDQIAGGAVGTRYTFWIKVTDNATPALSSEPVQVTGYILSAGAGVWLQRVARTASTATVGRLCPLLTTRSVSVTDSLDGTGSAEVLVTASEVRRRAADLGMAPQELLAPGAIEVAVYQGSQPLFVGPIYQSAWSVGVDEVTISAMGLMSYLERRSLPAAKSFVNDDWSAIVAELIDDTQGESYGALAIDTAAPGVAGTSGTLDFEAGTLVSDALGTILSQVGAPEAHIDAQRVLRASLTRGSDKTGLVRVTTGMVTVSEWETNTDGVVTVAHVTGGGKPGGGVYTGTYSDASAMATWGRVEGVYAVSHLTSDAACTALATKIVQASADRADRIAVTFVHDVRKPFTVTDIEVGDVIRLDVRDDNLGRVYGDYRVINKTVELAENTSDGFTVSLDMEPARYAAGRLVGSRSRHNPAMFERLSQVELRQRKA